MSTYYVLMEGFGSFSRLEKHVHEKLTEMAAAHELEEAPPGTTRA